MTVRDVLVLGCGRSGTSLVAGLFARSHEMGGRLRAADPANPKGFFEDRDVNEANERLLAPYDDVSSPGRRPLRQGERWLAVLPPGAVPAQPVAVPRGASPWCRKDPRLCHTLPVWRPQVPDAAVVVVIREPGRTAASLLAHTGGGDLGLQADGALAVWASAYRSLLAQREPGWRFVRYDDVLSGAALPALEDLVGTGLDGGFADPALRRSPDGPAAPPDVLDLHAELCDLAGLDAPRVRRPAGAGR